MITSSEIESADNVVVVLLALAKQHLKLDAEYTEEDTLIQAYIDAAVSASENFINGIIVDGTMTVTFDKACGPLVLDAYPVREITSLTYHHNGSTEPTTMPVDDYRLSNIGKSYQIDFLQDAPDFDERHDAVTVVAKVGYAAAAIPRPFIAAVLLQIGDLYERREDRGEIGYNSASANLLRPYRKY